MSLDNELVSDYALKGSESAFRTLVSRHVNLVFATAMRQVGDAGMAEEITQNVFIALANKSSRLGNMQTLAGWLFRTTLLECKERIRSEIRRRKREDMAAELATLEPQDPSALSTLAPLLDEALLSLCERDRLALVLRFMEDRSLRDVGAVLGVEEDAARKRVSRALDRVTEFFRCRGFVSAGGGASSVMLLAYSAKAVAPATLAAAAANAGLAANGTVGGIGVFIFHLMALTKLQTAALCIAAAAIPLVLQWQAETKLANQQVAIDSQIQSKNKDLSASASQLEALRGNLVQSQVDVANDQAKVTIINNQRLGKLPAPAYHWDDHSPLARIPKKILDETQIPAMTEMRGQLTSQIKESLQLTDAEANRAQSALNVLLSSFESAQAKTMKRVDPSPEDLNGRTAENVRIFDLSKVEGSQFESMKKAYLEEVNSALGEDRARLLLKRLDEVAPLEPANGAISSRRAMINEDFRLMLSQSNNSEDSVLVNISTPNSAISFRMKKDSMPGSWRNEVTDWLESSSSAMASEE